MANAVPFHTREVAGSKPAAPITRPSLHERVPCSPSPHRGRRESASPPISARFHRGRSAHALSLLGPVSLLALADRAHVGGGGWSLRTLVSRPPVPVEDLAPWRTL